MLNDQLAGEGWGMICFQKDTIFMPCDFRETTIMISGQTLIQLIIYVV